MRRKVDYTWRLAELMAARGLRNTTDLIPLLAERGIVLSRPQVYRLVNQRPERVSLQVVAAICDIFDAAPMTCSPSPPPTYAPARPAPLPRPTSSNSTAPSGHAEPTSSTSSTSRRSSWTRGRSASPLTPPSAADRG